MSRSSACSVRNSVLPIFGAVAVLYVMYTRWEAWAVEKETASKLRVRAARSITTEEHMVDSLHRMANAFERISDALTQMQGENGGSTQDRDAVAAAAMRAIAAAAAPPAGAGAPPAAAVPPAPSKPSASSGTSSGSSRSGSGSSSSDVPGARYQKFLVMLQVVEGFGAWSDAIPEYIEVAMKLNRTFVEPCVRNGCIEPCRFDAIVDVPPFDEAAAARGEDPLLLPYINDVCKLDRRPYATDANYKAKAYPLSAYVDMDAMAAKYPPGMIVKYKDWYPRFIQRYGDQPRGEGGRPFIPRSFCFVDKHNCGGRDVRLGDFMVQDEMHGRADNHGVALAHLMEYTDDTDIFIGPAYRARFAYMYQYPTVPINKWHIAAVNRFVQTRLNGGPFIAFHWRSEHVNTEVIVGCAETLANISHRLPHVSAERTRAILLADMPAPNTKNRMWNDYANGHSPERQQAMQIMMDAGMEKYDAHVQDIDAGVLSLRDYLFSQFATLYVTCQGNHEVDCHSCFRSGSNIVSRITRSRTAVGKKWVDKWFDLQAEDVPPERR